ncbi:MAG: DUF1214 domain-containing protein [Leptolyngbya sp.]|nr:DUF1214 domain-containing protein [Leptolyngbya sp.]
MSTFQITDQQLEQVVRHCYQYVAMYNTINNFAMQEANPFSTHGWNKMYIPSGLMNASVKALPTPNNDTLYLISCVDLRDDAVVIEFPAFDSNFVSLETSAYDHYVNIPLSTTKGDFKDRTTMLFYTEHTKGYHGEPVEGVDQTLKMSGNFAIVFLRVAPMAVDPDRMKNNLDAMQTQKLMTLSEYQGKPKLPTSPVEFPTFGLDQTVFKNNFLEVIQFVFNQATFDANDAMDQAVLEIMKPLGIEPGKAFDPQAVAQLDGEQVARVAKGVYEDSVKVWNDPNGNPYLTQCFQPKGQMTLEPMVLQSCMGPVGQPYDQAQYPGVGTADGQPIRSTEHYVIRMTKDQLPPAHAFWSITMYDATNIFFIPNANNKYSVGENGGMKLDENGGIEIHIAPTQPEGVPAENWLPSGEVDQNLVLFMRVYAPDVEAMKTYKAPKVEKV